MRKQAAKHPSYKPVPRAALGVFDPECAPCPISDKLEHVPVNTAVAPSAEDLQLTGAQWKRRRRIVDSAIALAAQGGYEAVQMREVAASAGVALGTLYRYFSSKEHLLVVAMGEQVAGLRQRFQERPPRGSTAAERVMDVIRRATRALQRQPMVTAALLKSVISANTDVAEAMHPVERDMTAIVTSAMHGGEPTDRDVAVARVIQHVWLASMLWWVAGLGTEGDVEEMVNTAVQLMLENGHLGRAVG